MKKLLYILLSLMVSGVMAQTGVTTNGALLTTGTTFVNQYGAIGNIPSLNQYGSKIFTLGTAYNGGIISYIDVTGYHGLIATTGNQSTGGASWATGCVAATGNYGATGTAIGTGLSNTNSILTNCATAGIAARLCSGVTIGGYSDWYLPSKDELYQLFLNKEVIGNWGGTIYLSSSSVYDTHAWYITTSDGTDGYVFKTNTSGYVRCIRSF